MRKWLPRAGYLGVSGRTWAALPHQPWGGRACRHKAPAPALVMPEEVAGRDWAVLSSLGAACPRMCAVRQQDTPQVTSHVGCGRPGLA